MGCTAIDLTEGGIHRGPKTTFFIGSESKNKANDYVSGRGVGSMPRVPYQRQVQPYN